jgi:Skp family chaperone for outer membrane proteins
MEHRFRYLLAAALLTAAIPCAASAQDRGQATPKVQPPGAVLPKQMPTPFVAVIDFQLVVKESAAGKSVRSQIDERQKQFQAEIKPIQQELESVRAEFATREPGVGEPEFAAKRNAMRERVSELQRIIQERKRELDDMFNNGMHQVDLALVAVLKELAEERGINLILNAGRGRGLVLFAENQIVITEEALRRLDARLPKVELTKPEAGK